MASLEARARILETGRSLPNLSYTQSVNSCVSIMGQSAENRRLKLLRTCVTQNVVLSTARPRVSQLIGEQEAASSSSGINTIAINRDRVRK